jgi:hypothetical protein
MPIGRVEKQPQIFRHIQNSFDRFRRRVLRAAHLLFHRDPPYEIVIVVVRQRPCSLVKAKEGRGNYHRKKRFLDDSFRLSSAP